MKDEPNIRWVDTSAVPLVPEGKFADLFCGAGGLSLGFVMAGYEPVLGVECDPKAAETYQRNFPETWLHDGRIEDLGEGPLLTRLGGAQPDVICGGPPCQGMYTSGRRNPDDPRNRLFVEFLRIVGVLRPHFVVLEGVPGMLSLDGGSVARRILEGLSGIGYPNATLRTLEAAEFGVPQLRRRVIIIANRHGLPCPYPRPLLGKGAFVPVEAAIDDLKHRRRDPSINHEWTGHSRETQDRIARVAPGRTLYEDYPGSWRRLRLGLPSMTVKANHGTPHIHYELPRTISVREMARLQSFPDDFIFSGDMGSAMCQVANAVPPLLAKHVALALRPSLDAIMEAEEHPER
jgi:DNA (cytosine-5)-methyltransferase 1